VTISSENLHCLSLSSIRIFRISGTLVFLPRDYPEKGIASNSRLERDGVAEQFQATNESTFQRLALALLKVIASKFVIGLAACENVVDDDEDGVAEGHQGFLRPAPSGEAMIVC
jgi:hypothetical protein